MPRTRKQSSPYRRCTRFGLTARYTEKTARAAAHNALPARGFALIIALVLMGFILLLVLSLSSLTRVHLAGANLDQSSQYAQRNALLALNIALGQLQKHAGPDRHTSARADISVTGDDTAEHPYWTGVWGYTGNSLQLQTYLVSGNHNPDKPLELDALTEQLSADESVTLLTATDADEGTGKVIAQKVSIEENGATIGSYAYWISDEGIKAKVNLAQTPAPTGASDNFPLLNPQQFGINQITDLSWFPIDDSQSIKSLINKGTLSVLASQTENGSTAAIRNRFHDITLHSYGVLSDSNKGGLKRDLTVGLRTGSTAPEDDEGKYAGGNYNADDRKQIFKPVRKRTDALADSGLSEVQDPGGPLWSQLRSWVNTGLNNNRLPVRPATDQQAGFAPVIAGFQIYYVPVYNVKRRAYDKALGPDHASHNEYREISILQVPAVVLWNPYDVTLGNNEMYRVELGRMVVGDSGYGAPFSTNPAEPHRANDLWVLLQDDLPQDHLKDAAYEGTDRVKHSITSNMHTEGNDKTIQFHIKDVTLAPGEAKVYSLGSNLAYFNNNESNRYFLQEGFRHFGAHSPLREAAGPLNHRTLHKNPDYESYMAANPGAEHDPEIPESLPYLMHFKFDYMLTRVGALLLSRWDTAANGWQLLSEAVYLNPAAPFANTKPAPGEIIEYPKTASQQVDISNAVGVKMVRRFTTSNSALTSGSDHARPTSDLRWLVDTNPRATTSGPNPMNYLAPVGTPTAIASNFSTTTNPSYLSQFHHNADYAPINNSSNNAYIAHRETAGTGSVTASALFEAPRGLGNLFSLGQLTHAPLYRWNDANPQNSGRGNSRNRVVNSRFDNLIPAYPIGNGQANPAIELNAIYRNIDAITQTDKNFKFNGVLYDYSYLLNEALLDSYFFSTLIDSDGQTLTNTARNPRIVPINGGTVSPSYNGSAAKLMVDGAFNINSTSVEAWKALLASYYGKQVNDIAHNDTAPILRVMEPTGASFAGTGTNGHTEAAAYQGYRTLNDAQITSLAKAIVAEIKAYAKANGPFPTLAQFINRNPRSSVQNHQIKGALARAIQKSSVNEALAYDSYKSEGDRVVSAFNQPASEGFRTEGLPGWLTSADILSRLGSVLTARSDTFLIRTYGEYTDPASGNSQSKAWCEAVVQRLPDYIDGVTAADASPAGINAQFGRRFAVVSFRWLTEDEL